MDEAYLKELGDEFEQELKHERSNTVAVKVDRHAYLIDELTTMENETAMWAAIALKADADELEKKAAVIRELVTAVENLVEKNKALKAELEAAYKEIASTEIGS